MQPETARQCMNAIGLSEENTECVASLLAENRQGEAKQRLRKLRCELMDELHTCQRKVDRLDWLIRETEKPRPVQRKGGNTGKAEAPAPHPEVDPE